MTTMTTPECKDCGAEFSQRRAQLGYRLCLSCGEKAAVSARASWCVAPVSKSNYVLITNPSELRGLNPKQPK